MTRVSRLDLLPLNNNLFSRELEERERRLGQAHLDTFSFRSSLAAFAMSTHSAQSSTNLFRRLAWQSSIHLFIRLADGEPGAGSGSDRYYMQAPRHSYLPLLLPEIRENLVELALDDQQLADTDEKDWWFEEEVEEGSSVFVSQGPCRWHWPLDLIELYSFISRSAASSSDPTASSSTSASSSKSRPLRLLLHLSNPPADKLLLNNTVEACKTQYINQVKEADFVRWRNTTKVTNLRRADLEAGWDGIVQDDYDLYMRMASRILPLPIAAGAPSPSIPSRPPSTDPGSSGPSKPESAYTTRALPVKLYLPDNAPVIQEVVPPMTADGMPLSILALLRQHLPLLFPALNEKGSPYDLAIPVAQGIEIPPEAEVAWLSACMCGVDGWLRIGIQLRAA
ncbi:autophagy protein Apg5-domain-containing protein [Kockovaella imperatae]|uniref:Autophagy protein 5 n=1 Tax=Kockovaella imperatae TaxID=4999 RepID=A0A1Y1ULG8_9TREE|nr:autophagy protein Apg5-domain-containing protein [Kockovaella imperatae]ORX38891.1 autophagy protein Apg5-domain-containing protein [Kockovaella imperatae]